MLATRTTKLVLDRSVLPLHSVPFLAKEPLRTTSSIKVLHSGEVETPAVTKVPMPARVANYSGIALTEVFANEQNYEQHVKSLVMASTYNYSNDVQKVRLIDEVVMLGK